MTTLNVGLVQMDCVPGDKAHNLDHAKRWLEQLPDGVEIACLPEFFSTG